MNKLLGISPEFKEERRLRVNSILRNKSMSIERRKRWLRRH
jgi:hypothetical protein